ncbi:MAG: metal-dependent transcriptional regulator [Candidatus Dormibacteraceae bacterium]
MPNRRTAPLSRSQGDYLKALYELGGSKRQVGTSEIAERLDVRPASATGMLTKLARLRLATHDRYRGATLSDAGEGLAVEMIRHHRLIETYLVRALGYRWDEVHEEAERLEHVISERMEAAMFEALGRPRLDPHGDPIPTLAGRMEIRSLRPLDQCRAAERVTVRRVLDRDPARLRALAGLDLTPDAVLEVVAESRWEGPVEVRVKRRRRRVPLGLARAVFVERASA